jgi:predicted nucleic acid-binding Zn ribbon protein
MKCKQCGADIPSGTALCSRCGATQRPPRTRRCPRCGARVPHGAALCPQCGGATGQARRWIRLALSIALGIALGIIVFLALHARLASIRYELGRSLIDASAMLPGR